jgi:hypothetical protein
MYVPHLALEPERAGRSPVRRVGKVVYITSVITREARGGKDLRGRTYPRASEDMKETGSLDIRLIDG